MTDLSIDDVFNLAKQHRIQFHIDGDKPRLSAPVKPPAEVLEVLKACKAEIIAYLQQPRYQTFSFVLDGTTKIQALLPEGQRLDWMITHLASKFGSDRVTNVASIR